jgi:hypothetical protein
MFKTQNAYRILARKSVEKWHDSIKLYAVGMQGAQNRCTTVPSAGLWD